MKPHRYNIGRIVGVHFELNKPQSGPMKLCLHCEHLGYLYRSNYKKQISHKNEIVKKRLTASFFCHIKTDSVMAKAIVIKGESIITRLFKKIVSEKN